MTFVVGTHNRKKAGEMLTILSELVPAVELKSLADFPGAPEPEETGSDYRENALIKARSAARFTGLPSIADDAGLEIDALDGAPGLYSKRFGGEDLPFPQKMRILLSKMEGVSEEHRSARFRCWIAFCDPGIQEVTFGATCEGRISFDPAGEGGLGYDPIFYLPELGCTMGQLDAEDKHKVSHRGKVLRQFAAWAGSSILL